MEKPWYERRYPEDFGGWLPLGLIRRGRYMVIESPDKRHQCVIHLADSDVAAVLEAKTGATVYTHPVSFQGARILLEVSKRVSEAYAKR